MKILLDPQIYYFQKFGGISRYYTEIFSFIRHKPDSEVILPLLYSENEYAREQHLMKESFLMKGLYKVTSALHISTRTLQKKRAGRYLEQVLSKTEFDVFIPTYFDPYFLSFTGNKPFVLTVYDMIHELFPEYYADQNLRIVEHKLLLMEKATMIIAVSENTKRDILNIYPHINENKIVVIYHGTSLTKDHNVTVNLPADYILYVGERANYKNFHFLLRSAAPLLQENKNLHLICAGGGSFKKEEMAVFTKMGLANQIIQKPFRENELAHFYAGAKCFVFPSLYEGFGIPVLEAMVCGCPVLLGHHSSFPEVAADAGVYVNLDSEEDLKNKIQLFISDEAVRQEFSLKSKEQAKKFTWSHAADQCYEVYKKAISEQKRPVAG